jgi:hypothetical protein
VSATAASLPFTAVVGTIQGWPDIEPNVRSLEVAAGRVGGEVIVVDGSGQPAPPPGALGPAVCWIAEPGTSVFRGRLRGYRKARGEIVAITEDHCLAPPSWAERMIAGHREHPEAAAIGGSVENGASRSAMDWASFIIVQVAVMAPIRSGVAARLSGAVNVSYKRRALDAVDDNDGMGVMDGLHQAALLRKGERLVADDRIRIVHDQSLGFRGTTAIHFHAGRTMSAFRRQTMGPREWARFVGAFVVPIARFGRIVALGGRKGYARHIARSAPAIVWLLYAQALGQFLGYATGAGGSANQLQ